MYRLLPIQQRFLMLGFASSISEPPLRKHIARAQQAVAPCQGSSGLQLTTELDRAAVFVITRLGRQSVCLVITVPKSLVQALRSEEVTLGALRSSVLSAEVGSVVTDRYAELSGTDPAAGFLFEHAFMCGLFDRSTARQVQELGPTLQTEYPTPYKCPPPPSAAQARTRPKGGFKGEWNVGRGWACGIKQQTLRPHRVRYEKCCGIGRHLHQAMIAFAGRSFGLESETKLSQFIPSGSTRTALTLNRQSISWFPRSLTSWSSRSWSRRVSCRSSTLYVVVHRCPQTTGAPWFMLALAQTLLPELAPGPEGVKQKMLSSDPLGPVKEGCKSAFCDILLARE